MLWKNGTVTAIAICGKAASMIWVGAQKVWELMRTRSCFGRGYWCADKPWIGSDAWKH